MNELTRTLIDLAEAVAAQEGIKLATLSTRVADDGQLLPRLAAGKADITTTRFLKLKGELEKIQRAGSAALDARGSCHAA